MILNRNCKNKQKFINKKPKSSIKSTCYLGNHGNESKTFVPAPGVTANFVSARPILAEEAKNQIVNKSFL